MGAVLAVCLAMVVGASFFAYKNLYFAGKVFKGQQCCHWIELDSWS
jgi:hypothetical protein